MSTFSYNSPKMQDQVHAGGEFKERVFLNFKEDWYLNVFTEK